MKCPSCQTYVTKIPVNWKCPHCGERLPDPSKWYLYWQGFGEYLQDRGVIFWSVWFGVLLLFIASVELLLGGSHLFSYIGNSLFMTIVGIFYTGMLIDMVMKINLPLRLASGTDFIIRERLFIRNMRKGTNAALVVGFVVCLVWLKPRTLLEVFPAYPLVISWFLTLAWSIAGLFFNPKLVDDVRFRAYMDRLGITSLKYYRRVGTIMIGVLVVVAIGFNILTRVPGLWIKISNTGFVGVIITFLKQYFSWMF